MDLPERLVMSPGQTFSADLPGLGGAGYLWSFEIVDPSDPAPDAVVAAAIERGGARQPASADERPAVGASLPETLLISAQAPGTATVQVVQRLLAVRGTGYRLSWSSLVLRAVANPHQAT